MRFVILGSGGRENAIIRKLLEDTTNQIICISNSINPDIEYIVSQYYVVSNIYNTNTLFEKINEIYSKDKKETIVVPGSETFLEIGLVDELQKFGIPCIGPLKHLANIETSKSFCRNYLTYNHLDKYQPKYQIIYSYVESELKKLFQEFNYNFVIKADGLCGGKGVRVYSKNNYLDALEYSKALLINTNNIFNPSKFIVEERLYGEEFSLMSFCDGLNIKHMPLVQDYKDLDIDNTIKTGGMGSIILDTHSFPFLLEDDIRQAHELNNQIMLNLSRDSQLGYRGILYGGFMKTDNGVKLIEYNARFGDPECINLLSLLETSLSDIFKSIVKQNLDELDIQFRKEYSLCKYLVPHGYPLYLTASSKSTFHINDSDYSKNIIMANVVRGDTGNLQLKGSRSMAIISTDANLKNCILEIDRTIETIDGPLFYRKDIGNKYLLVNQLKQNKDIYESSGVSITEGDLVVSRIKKSVEKTHDEFVISNFGDFGGLYDIGKQICSQEYKNPILVSSTDGVGTKTKLVLQVFGELDGLYSLGQDIVNHSVNDILVKGAKPLFFLDYVASSEIKADKIVKLVEGISDACQENGVALLGGETAEMPGIYQSMCYDIVGTIVGICDKNKMIQGPDNIREGDIIIGYTSSGPHTNGYSLIRKILSENNNTMGHLKLEDLVKPHKSYLQEIKEIQSLGININGLCHITGGGYYGNLPRVLPDNLAVELQVTILEPFATLQRIGKISNRDMYSIFNCGYGMLVFVRPEFKDLMLTKTYGHMLGTVTKRGTKEQIYIF